MLISREITTTTHTYITLKCSLVKLVNQRGTVGRVGETFLCDVYVLAV